MSSASAQEPYLGMVGLARGSAILFLLSSAIAAAQGSNQTQLDRYQGQYGVPIRVTLLELVSNPGVYEGMSVQVRGLFDGSPPLRRTYLLRDPLGSMVHVLPVPEAEAQFTSAALGWIGSEVEVTGVFERSHTIKFWKYLETTEAGPENAPTKAAEVTLEDLVSKAGDLDGKTVRVVGQFRGRNLFGDLPVRSERDSSDWVIKDDLSAVWITGKGPKGSGWNLDLGTKRDTNRWIEVVGRPDTVGNVTYIRALSVVLGERPRAPSEATTSASVPPPALPKVPPVIVFSIPSDGERDVPSTGVFLVQFSEDMDEESFHGRVLFAYAGPRLPGDRDLVGVKVTYDKGRRALTVDPGDVLRPGRAVELRLLPGIVDIDGLALTSEVLRFDVAPLSGS